MGRRAENLPLDERGAKMTRIFVLMHQGYEDTFPVMAFESENVAQDMSEKCNTLKGPMENYVVVEVCLL